MSGRRGAYGGIGRHDGLKYHFYIGSTPVKRRLIEEKWCNSVVGERWEIIVEYEKDGVSRYSRKVEGCQ